MTPEELESNLARDWDRIRGLLCGLIEAFNLAERHERSAISSLKSFTYDRQKEQLDRIREYLNHP